VAGRVGAQRLVLIKPPGATAGQLVDSYFRHALPPHVTALVVPADQGEALRLALRGGVERG
jgi:SpoU rRNA methylase family enzyme